MKKNSHKLTDEISETMREVFETTEQSVVTRINQTLYQGDLSDPETWKRNQARLNTKLKNGLLVDAKRARLLIRNAIAKAGEKYDFSPQKIYKEVDEKTAKLIDNAIIMHRSRVRQVLRLERTRPLAKAIFDQTQSGIDEGMPVATRKGSVIGFKEYMEMNVRTTVQSEISERQIEQGRITGIVFYIVNVFEDCADDHKDYQGRVYYDDRYASFPLKQEIKDQISALIKSDNLLSIQEVREKDPFLTTRPNCRHAFNAISIDQALNIKPDKLVKDLGIKTGTYKPKNYKQMQEQRKNERTIRHYKARKEQNERLYKQRPTEELKNQIQKDKALVSKWQKRQRDLLEKNPTLERDYRRETRKILVNDLGAKYNLRT